jgi:RNA polymerase sigma-70 factor, ECF subfamily
MADVKARLQEADLISRCQRGDLAAFDRLVNLHADRVFNLTYRMLACRADAEDAAQEAFLRAYTGLRRFRRGAAFSTWLYRIAINVCLDELKRRHNRPQPFTALQHEDDIAGAGLEELAATTAADDPVEIVSAHAEKAAVEQALADLPDDQRAVVVMCDLEELTYEEAAVALSTNVGTIKSRLHRARHRLRELLSPNREQLANS